MLIPRIDMFYQGERDNSNVGQKPNGPDHVIPDYTIFNGRLTYVSADAHWSLSLVAQNLFNRFYWISIYSNKYQDLSEFTYSRLGQPGSPPRRLEKNGRRRQIYGLSKDCLMNIREDIRISRVSVQMKTVSRNILSPPLGRSNPMNWPLWMLTG